MRRILIATLAAVAAASLTASRRAARAEEEPEDEGESGGSAVVVRPQRDVACDLRLASGATAQAPGDVRLVVRNRGRRNEPRVEVAVYADVASGTPLWSARMAVRAHRRVTRHLALEVPSGTTSLVAVASCAGDGQPGNDVDRESFGEPSGSPYPTAGAALFAASCASCHGADARGTPQAPALLGRSAGDVYEAVHEGEDGMPRFPGITWQDARNLAAWLADPSAPVDPVPPSPPAPPPTTTTPTYTVNVRTILTANCTSCHTGTSAPVGVRLDTYATASANASRALAAMQGGTMPPGRPMSASNVQVFADWVAGGTPK